MSHLFLWGLAHPFNIAIGDFGHWRKWYDYKNYKVGFWSNPLTDKRSLYLRAAADGCDYSPGSEERATGRALKEGHAEDSRTAADTEPLMGPSCRQK